MSTGIADCTSELMVRAPVLDVRNLTVRFVGRSAAVHAVTGVTFSVQVGEALCILGESGSGKTVMLRALMRLLPQLNVTIAGDVWIDDRNILKANRRSLQGIRGRSVAMVFQEPMMALDPIYTIGHQITETILRHDGGTGATARARASELLERVGIPNPSQCLKRHPHELSGGLCQRAMIAIALSGRPRLLLADEPTTALDASVQAQLLILLRRLQKDLGMSVVFVTHDFGVASEIADRIAVMYAGRIVEMGPVRKILRAPAHPYTAGLFASTLRGKTRGTDIEGIPGQPPDLRHLPHGCSFFDRCARRIERCGVSVPESRHLSPEHTVNCIRAEKASEISDGR